MEADSLSSCIIKNKVASNQLGTVSIHEVIDSTSTQLRKLLEQGAGHGTLVVANSQTNGRGRYGRYFHSPQGTGIYMSLLLSKPDLGLEDTSLITILAGTATCRALRQLSNKPVEIKWINDLFLDGKKIGGILTEAVGEHFIIGIGLNIQPPVEAFPEEIGEIVEFLYEASEESVSRNEIIATIVSELLEGGCQSGLISEYKSYSAVLGKRVSVSMGKSSYVAKALDIDEQGRLVVEKADLTIEKLCSGEVRIKL